jgi:Tol biopolymer transport system component/predicted Ser/Thr protein kinase
MPLQAGETLGPYSIQSHIGSGGMGDVYQATDTRLGRTVAIKISAERFSERFDREARAVAALNHPNICTLYDVGPNFLVMEYVEGENLQGPMPLEEAIRIGRQITDALDEAHQKGIVHRDLKPGNIRITPEGTVKVLDFGLAKVGATPTVPSENSPTMSMAATQAGVILGTAAYMSPEQARGKPVDKRADIWSFGAVFYEMLAGERLFQGEDITDTLAAVIRKEPEWDRVPAQTRPLLRACLEKEPKRRLRDIADVWRLLEADRPAPTEPAAHHAAGAWILAGALAMALAALAFVHFREQPPVAETVQIPIEAPEGTVFADSYPILSPDGRSVAFVARSADGRNRVWIRNLGSLTSRVLEGTEGVSGSPGPFWSSDSRYIAFNSEKGVFKIAVSGEPPVPLGYRGPFGGGTWNRDGVILFGSPRGILRTSEAGGDVILVTKADTSKNEIAHTFPQFLPDGQHFIYTAGGRVHLSTLAGVTKAVAEVPSRAQYAPPVARDEPGHLLFLRESTLMAQPVVPGSFELKGSAFPLAQDVGSTFGGALSFFSVSPSGALAFQTGPTSNSQPVWFDRKGNVVGTLGSPGRYTSLDLSRSGKQVAVTHEDERSQSRADIFLMDAVQGVLTKLTSDPANDSGPVWSPDDRRVVFTTDRGGAWGDWKTYWTDSSGTGKEELVLSGARVKDWSDDGNFLSYNVRLAGFFQLAVLPLAGDRKPVLYPETAWIQAGGVFAPSPPGASPAPPRWIAYVSTELGQNEVYVQSYPPGGQKIRISDAGGTDPRWGPDGKELFYIDRNDNLMRVEVKLDPDFWHDRPAKLFPTRIISGGPQAFASRYDISRDGSRFLILSRPSNEQLPSASVTVVLNWQAERKK